MNSIQTQQQNAHPGRIVFFGGDNPNNREACQLVQEFIQKTGIQFRFVPSSDVDNPKILDGFAEYSGLCEIKKYLEEISKCLKTA